MNCKFFRVIRFTCDILNGVGCTWGNGDAKGSGVVVPEFSWTANTSDGCSSIVSCCDADEFLIEDLSITGKAFLSVLYSITHTHKNVIFWNNSRKIVSQ